MPLYACVMSLILGFSSVFTSPWLYTRVFSLESIHVSYCPKVIMTYIFIYYSRAVYLLHFKEFINFISVPSSWCGADFILHPVRTPHLKSFLVTCTRRHHYTTQPSQCGHQQILTWYQCRQAPPWGRMSRCPRSPPPWYCPVCWCLESSSRAWSPHYCICTSGEGAHVCIIISECRLQTKMLKVMTAWIQMR